MAGTLTIGTLSDGTNSASATDAIMGSARAWVNFNGVTTATIRASYNVSSVTRNSTGNYTVNFTSALPDANYSAICNASSSGAAGNNQYAVPYQLASGALTIITQDDTSAATLQDSSQVTAAIFR